MLVLWLLSTCHPQITMFTFPVLETSASGDMNDVQYSRACVWSLHISPTHEVQDHHQCSQLLLLIDSVHDAKQKQPLLLSNLMCILWKKMGLMVCEGVCHNCRKVVALLLLLACIWQHIKCDLLCLFTIHEQLSIIVTLNIDENGWHPAIHILIQPLLAPATRHSCIVFFGPLKWCSILAVPIVLLVILQTLMPFACMHLLHISKSKLHLLHILLICQWIWIVWSTLWDLLLLWYGMHSVCWL